jgi:hypothetical protein
VRIWNQSRSRYDYSIRQDARQLTSQGSHFFYHNGTQFFVRGVFYSDSGKSARTTTSFIDILADDGSCSRDIPYFQKLGINTIIILDFDPTASHSACMQMLQNAGIYVLIQLNGRTRSSYVVDGKSFSNWDYQFYQHFQKSIDTFQQYPNTLGFYIGSSVISPKILVKGKAALIHMKDYINSKKYRAIPIGWKNEVGRREVNQSMSTALRSYTGV